MKAPLRILYLGDDHPHSTSRHRAEALKRIGCEVTILNPRGAYSHLKIHPKLNQLTGFRLVTSLVDHWVARQTNCQEFDLVWNDQCTDISRATIESLHRRFGRSLCFSVDDPTGKRDGRRWDTLKKAIPIYDCFVSVRVETEQEIRHLSGKKSLRVWRSYDEIEHAPFASEDEISQSFRSEVAFVGTWMRGEGKKGRDYFLLRLIEAGISVSIWGGRWQKSPCWPKLKPFWQGEALGGREYVAAIQGAKISLGFLSKGNRDLHTQRSAEIPYAGGLLCAERTSEHLQMYQDGVEAVFWSSPEECIEICQKLLKNEVQRRQIREAGMMRIRSLGFGNETVCRKILNEMDCKSFQPDKMDKWFRIESVYQTI